jgi:type VII secretion protein EccE
MAAEAIGAVALDAAGHGGVARAAGGGLGLVTLAAVLLRRGGRWWPERWVMTWLFRRRNATRPLRTLHDTRLAALQFLAPGLTVEDVDAPDGSRVGVAIDDAGWYAVAALDPGVHARPLPVQRLVTALADPERAGRAVVQVVTHTVPVPAAAGTAGDSYHGLLRRHGPIPVDRATWLAVRLDARALAEMGAAQPDEAPAMVASLLRHLTKTLRRSGVRIRPLDRDGLLDALCRSCDLTGVPGAPPPADPHEEWDAWYSGRLAHRTYWVKDWPPVTEAAGLLDALATVPSALTSVALVLAPGREHADIRCLARVAGPPNQLTAIAAAVSARARAMHAALLVLDGEHGPAAYATAPTGGGPR